MVYDIKVNFTSDQFIKPNNRLNEDNNIYVQSSIQLFSSYHDNTKTKCFILICFMNINIHVDKE